MTELEQQKFRDRTLRKVAATLPKDLKHRQDVQEALKRSFRKGVELSKSHFLEARDDTVCDACKIFLDSVHHTLRHE